MSNNLPLGAENDPRAPWNEPERKLIDVEVELEVIVTRNVIIQMSEGYISTELNDALISYAESKFHKEKNNWKVIDIDYKIIET